jgi:hypothetical protein
MTQVEQPVRQFAAEEAAENRIRSATRHQLAAAQALARAKDELRLALKAGSRAGLTYQGMADVMAETVTPEEAKEAGFGVSNMAVRRLLGITS